MKEKDTNINEEEMLNQEAQESTEATETAEASENAENANAEGSEPAEEKDPLEAAQEEIAELKNQLLYKAAEFDNYRKRTLKERSDMLKTANGDTLSGMLPVLDDLERAMQSMEKATDVAAVREGVVLIYNKLQEFLKNKGIVEIDAMNQVFDTDLHEAITKIPAPTEDLKGKVVDVIQKGYKIDTKVIRYAKVVVGE